MPNVRIHSVKEDWSHLDIVGLEEYWDRSLLMNGKVVAYTNPTSDFWEYLDDLRNVGVGPKPEDLVLVDPKTGSFYEDVCRNGVSEKIREFVQGGLALSLFSSSDAAESFLNKMGLSWEDTINPNRESFSQWSCKSRMRKKFKQSGFDLCPQNQIVSTPEELRNAKQKCQDAHGVVLKRPDCAGSEGMDFLQNGDSVDPFLKNHWKEDAGAIVEEAWEHYPASLVYEFTDSGVQFLYYSLQSLNGVDIGSKVELNHLKNGVPHRGNIVGSSGMDLGPVSYEVITEFRSELEAALQLVHKSGFRGRLCADVAVVPDLNDVFLLEFNPRTTHSTYVWEVQKSLQKHFNQSICVVGCNVEEASSQLENYEDLRSAVNLCSDKPAGVLFFHVPLFVNVEEVRKVGILGIGTDFAEAVESFREAEKQLK